jgi:dipeptidyl aminopeptidase/acylaminoacyl peptidase
MKSTWIVAYAATGLALLAGSKPMTFLDVLQFRTVSSPVLSKDGKQFAWVQSVLDWKSGRRYTDIYATDTASGVARRITFTDTKDESAPAFSPDAKWIGFVSNREAPASATSEQQLFVISPTGGEARRLSLGSGSVGSFAFAPDGRWIAFSMGAEGERQIRLYEIATGSTLELTKHATGIASFEWAPDSSKIYFTSPDRADPNQKRRIDLKFDVRIVNEAKPPLHLWMVEVASRKSQRLTNGDDISVGEFKVSRNGQWLSILMNSTDRFIDPLDRRDTEAYLYSVLSGNLTRLTDNRVTESLPQVSPDGQWLAFRAPEEFTYQRRNRIYLRGTMGGETKTLAGSWTGDVAQFHWSTDSKRIYFTDGVGSSEEILQTDIATGNWSQLTKSAGVLTAQVHQETGQFVIGYENPMLPRDFYLAKESDLGRRDAWRRLSDANPQVEQFALGQTEPVQWKSSDGATVEGLLVKPVGYVQGRKYPLIVQLHGGPASAYTQAFSGSYSTYTHVFAAGGYAVLQPNYRGSSNYGEKFRMQIAGDYFRQGFDDIMTGVDDLIKRGIADPDKLGLMGWSAGGHWSNWALTHTDRFKAISSGAGAVNWISMYAQTDVHDIREFYLQGTPYENWEHYLAVSPLKYIKNAKTPTLIHVGHDDPRVPRPQSEELHMALRKLHVPTEFIVYPRMGHGLTEPRYQMVKMASEYGWFERWIKGSKKDFLDWKQLLDTIPQQEEAVKETSGQ